jgi:glycosyltransferase involved in cell wall biosynthesis
MGTRGIPARYGGFETFYENLGPRLAGRGHEVTVYGRPHSTGRRGSGRYRQVRVINLPSIRTKHLETISHTALSGIHGLTQRYDIVYVCGVGNAPILWLPRIASKVVLNVDGADFRRAKWGRFATWYLRTVEAVAPLFANLIIADNRAVQRRLRESYGWAAEFVPYGADVRRDEGTEHLAEHGLEPDTYVLWVGRTEPETRLEELIQAFERLQRDDLQLVIVGDAPYAEPYKARLRALSTARTLFLGYRFGAAYEQLSCHAAAYVQTSPTSGTSPALLEQMAFGSAVIARGTDTNTEVIGDAGLTYSIDDPIEGLAAALRRVLDDPAFASEIRRAAVARIRNEYSWDAIVDRYESLFLGLAGADSATLAPTSTDST